ncbi:MBL fold metallo-hydrolase [Pseudomonas typographi]|uniref:MBL fold metallo-hydrolase n=1 Tax=Pseudomonas typographi TaxID=2715964 RepID=A0ABR7YY32_9PSED|nr:MBL fold metallo-hydrolase [Pseudomonas typographi]
MTAAVEKWHRDRERSVAQGLRYPFAQLPAAGQLLPVAQGIYWVRLPLPFALDHINVWALADDDGWTLIDTGLYSTASVETWQQLLDNWPDARPIRRVIVTHMHVDHVGMAGWFCERFACSLWMARQEYLQARLTIAEAGRPLPHAWRQFYQQAGWDTEAIDTFAAWAGRYAQQFHALPSSYRRLRDGENILIGGHRWKVLLTCGHSPEHASLYCPELKLYIAGDQVLPRISSNVSTHPYEPEADPLDDWYSSLGRIALQVPDDVLVLPSHNECFHGLHRRVETLRESVVKGLADLRNALRTPARVVDLFEVLFRRSIDSSNPTQYRMATGEAISHLNLLLHRGEISARLDAQGVRWYQLHR